MKILQIVESFQHQAVESWLIKILCLSRQRYPHIEWTFFCTTREPSDLDDIVRATGSRIIHSRHHLGSKMAFLWSLRSMMKRTHYDILHCHQDIMSAISLLASIGLPLRTRIVHVHNTSLTLPTSNPIKIKCMREPMRRLCLNNADHIVGVSQYALDAMLHGYPARPKRDKVIHCGITTERFRSSLESVTTLRQEFSFGSYAIILLFVGRMITYKNPSFVIELLQKLHAIDSRFAAVFAGTGPLEDEIHAMALQTGLHHRVKVIGWRDDIPQVMQACDILIWPGVESPKEGLGLAIVEAQAAGLPVLMSRNVPEEAVVISESVRILPLAAGAQRWADAVVELLACSRPTAREALARVEASSFSISQSTNNLIALYEGLA